MINRAQSRVDSKRFKFKGNLRSLLTQIFLSYGGGIPLSKVSANFSGSYKDRVEEYRVDFIHLPSHWAFLIMWCWLPGKWASRDAKAWYSSNRDSFKSEKKANSLRWCQSKTCTDKVIQATETLFTAIAKRGRTRTKSELNSAETEGGGGDERWVCLHLLAKNAGHFLGYLALLKGKVNVLW